MYANKGTKMFAKIKINPKKNSTKMKTEIKLTLRVYKEEYNDNQLSFLSGLFEVVDETANVLTISGTQGELELVMENAFTNDEKFKVAFPEYLTEEERKENTKREFDEITMQIGRALCRTFKTGDINSPIARKYRDFFVNELNYNL